MKQFILIIVCWLAGCGRIGFDSPENAQRQVGTGPGTCQDKLYNNAEEQTDCGGPNCSPCPLDLPSSCKALLTEQPGAPSGVYQLDPDGSDRQPSYYAYCEMSADGGGWTLALKIDGTQNNFDYRSVLWVSTDTFNDTNPALDQQEGKFVAFSSIAAKNVRIGMTLNGVTQWRVITPQIDQPNTLQQIFASETYTATQLGRAEWLGLMQNSTLQPGCNKEGFNIDASRANVMFGVRIGIVADDYQDCVNPDSFVGFGAASPRVACNGVMRTVATGNVDFCGTADVPAFGYVMVRE